MHLLSAHISTKNIKVGETKNIIKEINEKLKNFNITHTSLQFECDESRIKY
jgi:S-adenosylmethionine hydrolase